MKRSKILVAALAAMVVTTALVGCGKKAAPAANTTTPAPAQKESKKIVVWSHLKAEEIAAIKPIAEEWAKSTGNTVEVLEDKGDMNAFAQAAASAKAADIMYGLAHDNLGVFVKAGVVSEVPAGIVETSKYNQNAVNAVSIGGKKYGVPIAQETLGLFYNPDKVTAVPKDMNALIEDGKKNGFKYQAKDMYFSYAVISGFGGYIFKDNNGALDPKDIGLANDGSKKGFAMLERFAKELGMKSSVDSAAAVNEFKAGKIAYFISGPWDAEGLKKENVKFKVAPIPSINGTDPARPFLGVQAAFVNAKSKNQAEAWELMKYLVARTEKPIWEVGHRLPVLKDSPINAEVAKTDYAGFAEQAKNSYPMPNIPEMQAAWKLNDSLPLLLDGKLDANAFADTAVKNIKAQLDTQAK
jgi:arabinogalactan oligomer / maltooligosaccharide transport system substrate-binding protein